MMDIKEYQRMCYKSYKESIGYPDISFFYGNPINVLVPVETAINGIMIIGAYPSAKFGTINGITYVPLYDNDSPFSSEVYFDGSRVAVIPSGKELETNYLAPLGIKRKECWITDLVKVFLFKDGHVKRYKVLDSYKFCDFTENRSSFKEYARKSIKYIKEEISIAKPKLIICLGEEVACVMLKISSAKAKEYMDGRARVFNEVNDIPFMVMPHPGILMRESDKNPWPEKFKNTIIPNAKLEIERLI